MKLTFVGNGISDTKTQGTLIKSAREAAGKKQRALAHEMGFSPARLCQIETGSPDSQSGTKRSVSLVRLAQIAAKCGFELEVTLKPK